MQKYYNPRLHNAVVAGTGMEHPRRPHVVLGSELNGYVQGDLVDANGICDLIHEKNVDTFAKLEALEASLKNESKARAEDMDNLSEQIDRTIAEKLGSTETVYGESVQRAAEDERLQSQINDLNAAIQEHQDISGKADKTAVDAALATKADKSTTYTKEEVDNLIDGVDISEQLENYYTEDETDAALAGKQDTIDDLSTIRSGAAAGATAVQPAALTPIENDIDAIEGKIPSAASTSNQLADKAFVNSALADKADAADIPTALSQLSQDSTHRTVTDSEKSTWDGKQDTLTFDNAPTANSNNPVTSGGVMAALDLKADQSTTYTKTEVDNELADGVYIGNTVGTDIKQLKDKNNVVFYPQTHTKAVVDDNGYTVESRMQAVQDVVNQAQMAIGAVPSDLTPTWDSTNWVTSGGVFNETHKAVERTTTSTDGSGINASGATHTMSSLGYTPYISLEGCDELIVKQPTIGSSTYGIAFYNSSKTKISFKTFSETGTEAYIWKIYEIPDNAVYARWTVYASTYTDKYYEPAYRKVRKMINIVDGCLDKKDTILLVPAMEATNSGTLFTSADVPQGATIFYNFTTTSIAAYIIIHKSDSTVSYLGKTSTSSGGTVYNGSYTLPSNFTYAEIGAGSGGSLTINSIYCDKISAKPSTANNITTTEAGYVLDARQGKVLADFIKEGALMIDTSQFSWTLGWIQPSGAVHVDDSNHTTQYSGYIELDTSYKKIITAFMKSSTVRGGAFFTSSYDFISFFANNTNTSYGYNRDNVIDIPENAAYVRLTRYTDTTTYGQLQFGYKNDAANFADITNAISEKIDAVVGCENKIANPYFQTFASNGSLTKETVFSTSVDSGGGSTRRIPSVVVTNAKTVIAATEVRSAYADNAQTGIILARKTSDANSWTYNFVLPYNAESYGKVMNPSFIIDRSGAHGTTGRIYLFFIAFQITSGNNGYAYLCTSSEIDNMYVYSDDDGVTWSSPVSTKSAWDTDSYNWMGVSPANGALMSDGTFALPCMGYKSGWYSGVMYKTPSGSWTYSKKTSEVGDNESTVFVYDGKVYLNCRNENSGHLRTLYKLDMTSNEMVKIDYDYDPNVICQQSICNGTILGNSTFFQTANAPLTYNTRNKLTVFVSKDGMKWARLIRVNDNTTYGYSVADCYDGKLVMVYENSGSISFIDLSLMATTIGTVYSKVLGKPLEDRLHELIEKLLNT